MRKAHEQLRPSLPVLQTAQKMETMTRWLHCLWSHQHTYYFIQLVTKSVLLLVCLLNFCERHTGWNLWLTIETYNAVFEKHQASVGGGSQMHWQSFRNQMNLPISPSAFNPMLLFFCPKFNILRSQLAMANNHSNCMRSPWVESYHSNQTVH